MLRKLFTVLFSLILIFGTVTIINAGDPFQKEENCQACLDSALSTYEQCIATFGEGDADCRAQYNYTVSGCQRDFCID